MPHATRHMPHLFLQAALRYLMLEAVAQGGLQRDIDQVMAALDTMTESDDDSVEQAAGKDAPTGATLLSLVPDPATAGSKVSAGGCYGA